MHMETKSDVTILRDYASLCSQVLVAGILGGVGIIVFKNLFLGSESTSKFSSLCTQLRLTVGIIVLASLSSFMELYLRILALFQLHHPLPSSESEVDAKLQETGQNKISYRAIFGHLCSFGQRLLTFLNALSIVTNSGWNFTTKAAVSSIILIPRIVFSLSIIRSLRDLSRPQPNDQEREVSLTRMLAHYVYKGFRNFHRTLNAFENVIFFFSKQIQFLSMQLMGHSYYNSYIRAFGDLETIIFVGWNILRGLGLCTTGIHIFSLILIFTLRLNLRPDRN